MKQEQCLIIVSPKKQNDIHIEFIKKAFIAALIRENLISEEMYFVYQNDLKEEK